MRPALVAAGLLGVAAAAIHPGLLPGRALLLASLFAAGWLAHLRHRAAPWALGAGALAFADPVLATSGRALLSALLALVAGWVLLRIHLGSPRYHAGEAAAGAGLLVVAGLLAWLVIPASYVRDVLHPSSGGGVPLAVFLTGVAFLALAALGVPGSKRG